MKWGTAFLALLALCVAASARADELKLKDGTKISGTIVGFEENSFKVKTSYGFAVVQKNQVVSISIKGAAESPQKPEAAVKVNSKQKKEEEEATAEARPSEKPAPASPVEKKSATPSKTAPAPAAPSPSASAKPAPPNPSDQPATPSPAPAGNNAAAAPAPDAQPLPIREQVTGNDYANLTYGFEMYKPPDWQVIAGARSLLPGAITAMGTEDQRTYLLIGRQAAEKSVFAQINATQQRLTEIVDHFRPLGETHVTVSGLPAIERRFRGSADQHDWSGIVVYLPRGAQLYTIFGMTRADSDLVQIQENVIARAISSLRFTQ